MASLPHKKSVKAEEFDCFNVLAGIGEGVLVINCKEEIIFVNKAAEELFGFVFEKIAGKKPAELIEVQSESGQIIPDNERPLHKTVCGKEKVSAVYYLIGPGKRKFPAMITASPFFCGAKICGAVAIFRDVTKEREIDRAKNEFISLASHQLRTPLSTIKWLVEVIMEGSNLNLEQKTQLQQLFDSNERLINLVSDLLDVARIEGGKININSQRVNIGKLVSDAIELLRVKADAKGQKISFSVNGEIGDLNLDPMLFSEAFKNLLDNAIVYSQGKFPVKVSVENNGKEYVVSVHNEGLIPEEDKIKIFTKFYRGEEAKKNRPDGSGLGLFIARSAVEILGGKIWFESLPKKGVTFGFNIPIKSGKEHNH